MSKNFVRLLFLLFACVFTAYAQVGSRTFTATAAPGADTGIGNIGSGIAWHQLTWNVIGDGTGCSVKAQQAPDNTTWSDLITSQVCTANGQSAVVNVIANYIRINVTAFAGTGSVVVHWNGFTSAPSGGGTIKGTTTANYIAYGDSTSNTITGTNDLFFQNGLLIIGNGVSGDGTLALVDNNGAHHVARILPGANTVDVNISLPPTLPTVGQVMTVQSINTNSPLLQWSAPNVTASNCAGVGTAANPSIVACAAAIAGHFSCTTNASTGTCQVNTTSVTANSEIFVFESDTTATGTALGVTCNTSTTVNPATRLLASSIAGASFTINLGTITTNPACFSYWIVN